MRLTFTGRHVEVTPALQEHGRERIAKLLKFLPGILEAHVILSVEKYRHRAEVNVHTRRADLSAVEETGDMYSSLTQAFEKLERQARKRKDKVKGRKRRGAAPLKGEPAEEPPAPPPANNRLPRLVRVESPELKPMSIEDAVLQVQDSERGFVVFRNSRSQRINVVYRRGDGRYGVIEA